jgi:type VI secretion system ImpC/EvpB family protein
LSTRDLPEKTSPTRRRGVIDGAKFQSVDALPRLRFGLVRPRPKGIVMSSGPVTSPETASAAVSERPIAAGPGSNGAAQGLLQSVLDAQVAAGPNSGCLSEFLHAPSLRQALQAWFGDLAGMTGRDVVRRLSSDIAAIDAVLNAQLNAIIHHRAFQRLEAAWRSLHYLVECAAEDGEPTLKIKVLHCSWREVERDVESAIEFDQSQLFRKVYDAEFGMPGGEPLGMLIGDYEIHPTVSAAHPHDDISVLGKVAAVAAAAFCPFVASASPSMFELEEFGQLEVVRDLEQTLSTPNFLRWRSLRDSEDSRFVGLAVPRVLIRKPYADDGTRIDRFRFIEDVSGPDRSKYLWTSAAYALGETVIRAYSESGWLAGIRGVQRGVEGGGLVCRLPAQYFDTDRAGIAPQGATDVVITDQVERELSELGFIPLCQCHDSELAAFYTCPSIQKPKKYDRLAATQNARISAMLQYVLCASRFAHYLKVLAREKVGSFKSAEEVQFSLDRWIKQYVTPDDFASAESKARLPLREARVEVREDPGKPGSYLSVFHLRPHYELDDLKATVSFRTELGPPASR